MTITYGGTRWDGSTAAGIVSFLRTPIIENASAEELKAKDIRAAVFGIPFDGASMSRIGSNLGPRAIRNASMYFSPYHGDHDINYVEKFNLHDCGDSYIAVGDVKMTIENGVVLGSEILKAGAIPIVLGGEHTVSLAGTLAMDRVLQGKFGFIHFDGHLDADFNSGIAGSDWFHGSQVAHVSELDSFPGKNMVCIGMRGTTNLREHYEFAKERGISVFSMRKILEMGIEKVVDEALKIATNGTDGFYLTIDVDVLEAALVPGANDPTPFGLTIRELWSVLPKLGASEKLKAFDVVEVVPQYDRGETTALTASAIIVELLAARASIM